MCTRDEGIRVYIMVKWVCMTLCMRYEVIMV